MKRFRIPIIITIVIAVSMILQFPLLLLALGGVIYYLSRLFKRRKYEKIDKDVQSATTGLSSMTLDVEYQVEMWFEKYPGMNESQIFESRVEMKDNMEMMDKQIKHLTHFLYGNHHLRSREELNDYKTLSELKSKEFPDPF